MELFAKDTVTAFEAIERAQWIAFGPVIFQAARIMRDSGILQAVENSGKNGISLKEIAEKVKLPEYGVRVLLESGLGMGLVLFNQNKFTLGKTGHFMLHDRMTRVNMDFVQDVNYKGLFYLDESIQTGKPVGLKQLGNWSTVYEGLSQLPEHIQKSWFNFDHYFSDDAFPHVLPLVYRDGVRKVMDIGGNTGKWAIASAKFSPDIHVTIVDLPGQLGFAKREVEANGMQDQVSFIAANVLDETVELPQGYDAIWMSQFLDCFSEDQIVSILKRCYRALDDNGYVFIMEPLWDKQKLEIAAFCLQQTSLYFTAVANGNSQMYSATVFFTCIKNAGFEIVEETNNIGLSQSLLKCKKMK